MDKKGYIRTLEAVIAIVLTFIFILSILPQREKEEIIPKDIELTAEQILNEIQTNKIYRDKVFSVDLTSNDGVIYNEIKTFINGIIPITIGYDLIICGSTCYPVDSTKLNLPPLNIYTKSILITEEVGGERVGKLFLWRTI